MKVLHYFTLIFIITFSSCYRTDKPEGTDKDVIVSKKDQPIPSLDDLDRYDNEHMVLGTLYHQQAAEYRALCYQAYNLGKIMLDKDLADKNIVKHRVVILDVDETVLDNSPYQAQCILDDVSYPVKWDEWCLKAVAKPVPGSLEFLNYAKSNGVDAFYITNRKEHLKDATVKNLKDMGFPNADTEHVIMRTAENSKESRRLAVSEKYHVSLLFGDNLNDFTNSFENNSNKQRMNEADRINAEFGKRFIVLPNSMYGDWETALYNMDKKQSDSIKFQLRHQALIGF